MSFEQAVVNLEQTNAKLQEEVVRFRDAAMGLNNIYPTITEGRQNTDDGKYFSVPGNGAYMRLYRRQGTSAELVAEFADRSEINGIIDQLGPLLGRGVIGGSGDLIARGAFGVGDFGSEAGSNNYLDSELPMGAQSNGFRAISAANYPTDIPEGETPSWASVILNKRSSDTGAGLLHAINNDVYAFRITNGFIDRYEKLISQKGIKGTATQLDGVPTGAIIERGSNDNGEYTKFADGTLLCTREITHNLASSANVLYDYPHSFISNPQGGVSLREFGSNAIQDWIDTKTLGYPRTLQSWSIRSVLEPQRGTTTVSISAYALGLWY